jgi:hypothetical protein
VTLVISISSWFYINLRVAMVQLGEQYTIISALSYWKDEKTNLEKRDAAYNFVYRHGAIGIIRARETYVGKFASNLMEQRSPVLKKHRIEAEKYMNLHPGVVRPVQWNYQKIDTHKKANDERGAAHEQATEIDLDRHEPEQSE